jgi:hypothetical protein
MAVVSGQAAKREGTKDAEGEPMITKAELAGWGGWVLGALGFLGAIWNKLGINLLDVRTDGLEIKYVKAEKEASHAEGEIAGRDHARAQIEERQDKATEDAKETK